VSSENRTLWSPHSVSRSHATASSGDPDEAALLWLLVFGGIPPHLSPQEGLQSAGEMVDSTAAAFEEFAVGGRPSDDIRHQATRLLDEELLRITTGRKPLVLFSGGVDSSLMAARLVQLEVPDISLIHYQFRENDPETSVARQVAELLGLPLTVVRREGHLEGECLAVPGRTYPVPFGDQSTAPTAELCATVSQVADRDEVIVLDGTGADGAFGLGLRATRAHRRSPLVRLGLPVASAAYAGVLWRTAGRVEHLGRVLRRVHRLKPVAASIAQNSLFDVFYEAGDLTDLVSEWISIMNSVGVRDGVGQVVLGDLAITCARIFAQKTYGPLTTAGFDVAYPYLADPLVTLGLRHTAAYPQLPPKLWMKEQLEHHLNSALVHRPKSGFIDPERSLFDSPVFLDALHEGVGQESVFAEALHVRRLRRWLDAQDSLAHIPIGHQNLLWTLAFANRWYATRDVTYRGQP
jgi:hypothetical protein